MARKKITAKTKVEVMTKAKTARKGKTRVKAQEKEMHFTDGKAEEQHSLSMDIEELLNPPKNPFGTSSISKLEEKLTGMNLRQMQELAVKASVFPSGNKTSLKNKIKKEFNTKFGTKDSSKKYNNPTEQPIVDPDSALAKDIMDILNGK